MGNLEDIKLSRLPRFRKMLLSRIKMRILSYLPINLKKAIYSGKNYYCPVCDSNLRRFMQFGHLNNEWCPVCASMKRHRFMWVIISNHTNLINGTLKKVLHFAPESGLESKFREIIGSGYVTADLYDPSVQDRVDIMDMQYPDHTFDVIICSHVLEHVSDDRAAMRELARVIVPGGYVLVMVPYRADALTDEDHTVTTAEGREKRFGQFDHVRYYGRDITDRLEDSGLQVKPIRAAEVTTPEQRNRTGILEAEVLFLCYKEFQN